jgi:hypothetical protein
MSGVRYVPRNPPIHQIKEQKAESGRLYITVKCGKVVTQPVNERLKRATVWWQQVTCKECQR